MKLPPIEEPRRFEGLYIFDFGSWTSVGYTAEEIAVLLEDPAHREGKVFKIHRAHPNGQMEIRGVSSERFELESGMFFYRNNETNARNDFRTLTDSADRLPSPCRAYVHVSDLGAAAGSTRYVTAMLFPSEFEEEVGRWLTEIEFAGGDTAEGGISMATRYISDDKTILARRQLWGARTIESRSAEQLQAELRRPLQRYA